MKIYRCSILICAGIFISTSCFTAWGQPPASKTSYDKSTYYEDAVTTDSGDVRVLVVKGSGQVAYFWSKEKDGWIETIEYPGNLQKAYRDQRELSDMQSVMDQFHEQSFQEHQGQ